MGETSDVAVDQSLFDWLLDSDPALRWQVERDLAREPESVWQSTRARVATEGFGAKLLALQDDDGQWAGGAYFPADFRPDNEPGQPWTATTWSLKSLREWGVDAEMLDGTVEKLAANCRWEYDNLPYWGGEVDACINSYTVATGAWLGADVADLAQWFIDHQMDEGGWNCEWVNGSTRASFDSTLNSVRGILEYERAGGEHNLGELRRARHRAEEYLLQRRLLYRLSDGEPIRSWATNFFFPFRWYYSALKAVDHFRSASLHDGIDPDPRLADAVGVIEAARNDDGVWIQQYKPPGRVWFEVDSDVGEPSRWLTFHSLRALDWWHTAAR